MCQTLCRLYPHVQIQSTDFYAFFSKHIHWLISKTHLILRTLAGRHQLQNRNCLLGDLSHDEYLRGPGFREENAVTYFSP